MSKWRNVLEAPRRHPFGVLATHIPVLAIWAYFAVRDLADGSLTLRKHAPISLASEPIQFSFVATLIGAVAIFIAARIVQATLTLAGR